MRRMAFLAVLFVCFISLMMLVPLPAQTSTNANQKITDSLVLYDSFNGPALDPAKWAGWSATEWATLEAVRDLSPAYQGEGNNRRLRMYSQAHSWETFDSDTNWGWVGLVFKHPESITETYFTMTINSAVLIDCQSNLGNPSNVFAGFVGRFFNYGDGSDAQKDVEAGIQLSKASSIAGAPLKAYGYARSGDGYFDNSQFLGNVSVGQTVKLRVKWDRPSNQFIFQLNGNPEVKIQPTVIEQSPAMNGTKGFWVGRGVPGCSTTPLGSAMMDAYFDNVYVNQF
jgi:hypothetical protein